MSDSRRVLITGATGFIGQALSRELAGAGFEVVALSRSPDKAKVLFTDDIRVVRWDAASSAGWADLADGASAVINLAGENIGAGRWTKKRKHLILQSRLNAGLAVTEAVKKAHNKPSLLIQTSGIGYYGDRGDELIDEASSAGAGFLADVAAQWEKSVRPVEALGLRLATIRLAVVLGAHGGVIPRLILPFRFFLGGHPGSGKQWFPWLHIDDVVGVIRFLLDNTGCTGPFNLTCPEPILSKDFYTLFGKAMHRPAFFPMPAFALKLVLGEMAAELLLPSVKAVPQKLLRAGYEFKFPDAFGALQNVLEKTR